MPADARAFFRALLAACSIAAWSSCSQGAPQSAPIEPKASTSAGLASPGHAFTGHWKWSHATEQDGVRRIELERWSLAVAAVEDGEAQAKASTRAREEAIQIAGHYTRTIDFLSQDGMPFSCSQNLHYQLRATYEIRGVMRDAGIELAEVAVRTEPSPCEPGKRALGRYNGSLDEDGAHLRLSWDGGAQTLARVRAPNDGRATSMVAAMMPRNRTPANAAPAVDGSWRWYSRSVTDEQVRVELEEWRLDDDGQGALRGVMERTVTIFDQRGTYYPCSGDTFYQYRDRYTIRGRRDGGRLTLEEVSVEPEHHPCLHYHERHLDAASGALVGEHVELEWRGKRRQVLHRAATDANAR